MPHSRRKLTSRETAGPLVKAAVPAFSAHTQVCQAMQQMREQTFDVADVLYVVNDRRELLGCVDAVAMFKAPEQAKLGDLLRVQTPVVRPEYRLEWVAHMAMHHALSSVPVTDHDNRLLGAIPAQALMGVLYSEHVQDMHRLAGISHDMRQARGALEESPPTRARHRLPWLLVGLLGSVAATFVMSRYEAALGARVEIAFFVPGIVYLADAIGTQSEAVAVRGLSVAHQPLGKLLVGELGTGALIGLVLAALIFPAVMLIFSDPRLAAAVSLAVMFSGTAAAFMGLLLPWTLSRLGRDPAFGSGPVATVIQDVLSLLVYLVTCTLFLR